MAPNPHAQSSATYPSAVHAGTYAIPPDNPFIGATNFNGLSINATNVRTEFWAVGVRNAWRFCFDPANGELLLGLKLEDKYALANAEQNVKVPGIAFAEWGPGDMALSLGIRGAGNVAETNPQMIAARAKILAACKASHLFFLNSMRPDNVVAMIKEGVMVGPASQEAAEIGRKFTNRQMPW